MVSRDGKTNEDCNIQFKPPKFQAKIQAGYTKILFPGIKTIFENTGVYSIRAGLFEPGRRRDPKFFSEKIRGFEKQSKQNYMGDGLCIYYVCFIKISVITNGCLKYFL